MPNPDGKPRNFIGRKGTPKVTLVSNDGDCSCMFQAVLLSKVDAESAGVRFVSVFMTITYRSVVLSVDMVRDAIQYAWKQMGKGVKILIDIPYPLMGSRLGAVFTDAGFTWIGPVRCKENNVIRLEASCADTEG